MADLLQVSKSLVINLDAVVKIIYAPEKPALWFKFGHSEQVVPISELTYDASQRFAGLIALNTPDVTVTINGKPHTVKAHRYSYASIIGLAYPNRPTPMVTTGALNGPRTVHTPSIVYHDPTTNTSSFLIDPVLMVEGMTITIVGMEGELENNICLENNIRPEGVGRRTVI